MDNGLTVFTVVPPIYKFYTEFQLCVRMFKQSLPENSCLISKEGDTGALIDMIREHSSNCAPFILIVKEPALLMKRGTVEVLIEIMRLHPEIECVLPSDVRGYRRGREASYHTLRGLEKFTESLYEPESVFMPYDDREPWMFLIRRETIEGLLLKTENPLDLLRLLSPDKVCIALNSYIHPFIDYNLTTSRTDILPLIPEHIESLLDIGCYTGNFGLLVRERIGCRVVGCEVNTGAAEVAKANLDDIITGDILTAEINERFDCITCLDVIEHVNDTECFLRRVRDLLNEDGCLILSVPNIGHWTIVEDLLAGRWDYMPAGILCTSHVRFFTISTIRPLLEAAGFSILSITEQTSPPPARIRDALAQLDRFGIETDGKSLSCLGYYIVARKIA